MESEATEAQARKAEAREKMKRSLEEFFPQAEPASSSAPEAPDAPVPVHGIRSPEPEASVNLHAQALESIRRHLAQLSSPPEPTTSEDASEPGETRADSEEPTAQPSAGLGAAEEVKEAISPAPSQPAQRSRSQAPTTKKTKPQAEVPLPAELTQLKERLESTEREVHSIRRRDKTGFAVGVSVIVAAMMLAMIWRGETRNAGRVIRLPFYGVDNAGRVLLSVETDPGGTQLRLYNQEGTPVAWLSAAKEGGYVSVSGQEQDGGAMLWANAQGGQLAVSRQRTKPQVWLGGLERGGALTMWDRAGRGVIWLGTKEQGGSLDITNLRGMGCAHLFADSKGGQLGMTNQAGKPLAGKSLAGRTSGRRSRGSDDGTDAATNEDERDAARRLTANRESNALSDHDIARSGSTSKGSGGRPGPKPSLLALLSRGSANQILSLDQSGRLRVTAPSLTMLSLAGLRPGARARQAGPQVMTCPCTARNPPPPCASSAGTCKPTDTGPIPPDRSIIEEQRRPAIVAESKYPVHPPAGSTLPASLPAPPHSALPRGRFTPFVGTRLHGYPGPAGSPPPLSMSGEPSPAFGGSGGGTAARSGPAERVPPGPRGEAGGGVKQRGNAAGDLVRICPGGRFYHRPGCRRVQQATMALTRAEAASQGFRRCSTCQP